MRHVRGRGKVPGLHVFPDAVSASAEASILRAIAASPQPWTRRRTRASLDFGPYYRYRTVEVDGARYRVTDGVARHTPLPPFLHDLVMPLVAAAAGPLTAGFAPNQMHVAAYDPADGGRIHMHNDNKMGRLGPRIVGLCLRAGCKMTFVNPGDGTTRLVTLPRRCLYVMTGPAHAEWRHGIHAKHVFGSRVSITLREVRELNMVEGTTTVTKSRHAPASGSAGATGATDRAGGTDFAPLVSLRHATRKDGGGTSDSAG